MRTERTEVRLKKRSEEKQTKTRSECHNFDERRKVKKCAERKLEQ